VVVAGAVVVDVVVVVDVSRRVVDVDVVGHWRVGQKIHLRIWKQLLFKITFEMSSSKIMFLTE
jgi:hypothetical protein